MQKPGSRVGNILSEKFVPRGNPTYGSEIGMVYVLKQQDWQIIYLKEELLLHMSILFEG